MSTYAVSLDKGKTWITTLVKSGDTTSDQLWEGKSTDAGKTFSTYRKFVLKGATPPPPPPVDTPVLGVIDVLNFSKEPAANITDWCNAVKVQCDRDAAAYWGGTVQLNVLPTGATPAKGHWYCGFFNTSDEAGVLGWHDVGPNNEPLIKVFTAEARKFGENPSITLSHEVLESIGDTNANTTVKGVDEQGRMCLYFRENCDPVESLSYAINGVPVSDFVTLSWFNQTPVPGAALDFLKQVTKPFQILKGGYMEISYDNGNSWTEVDKASKVKARHHGAHSRWALYKKGHENRVKSTFKTK